MPVDTVTAIVPTYNRAYCIKDCIQSILDQKSPCDEIIVIDDGSTDDTLTILESFGDRIKVVSQKNSGVSAARNAGIGHAKGDWIAFLDSDDLWMPNHIQVFKRDLAVMANSSMHMADIKFNRGAITSSASLFSAKNLEIAPGSTSVLKDPLQFALSFCFLQSSIIRKSEIEAVGGFKEHLPYNEDVVFFCSLAVRQSWVLAGDIVAQLNRHETNDSLTGQQARERDKGLKILIDEFENILRTPLSDDQKKILRARISQNRFLLSYSMKRKGLSGSSKCLVKAYLDNPLSVKSFVRVAASLALGLKGYRLTYASIDKYVSDQE